jgi:iron(III) transport system substrate-binding protein
MPFAALASSHPSTAGQGSMRGLLWLTASVLVALACTPALAADHSWMSDKALVAAAKKEGTVAIWSSINEDEQNPQIAAFTDATGIKVDYIRGADAPLMSRMAIEKRAGKESWDDFQIQAVHSVPKEWLMQFTPSEAAALLPQARDPDKRWYGTYLVFHTPAYNTTKVKKEDLPKSYEDFAKHPEWKGHIALDYTDRDWYAGFIQGMGEAKGAKIMAEIVDKLEPTLYKGHLALARALGSGEYWLNLNNYLNLVLNVKLAKDPVDWWILEPVVTSMGEIGVNAKAPHPNAAKLLANFLISGEAQQMRTKWGRIPSRADIESNPPGILKAFEGKKTVAPHLLPADDQKWQKEFNKVFKAQG